MCLAYASRRLHTAIYACRIAFLCKARKTFVVLCQFINKTNEKYVVQNSNIFVTFASSLVLVVLNYCASLRAVICDGVSFSETKKSNYML